MNKYILPLLAFLPTSIAAQNIIDFESSDDFISTGVYDAWEDSPFRSGVLQGNWGLTSNPDKSVNPITEEVANPSETVLGAQRSRFGSNQFGVRIDLNEEIAITPQPKYVHVLLHKPTEGRVMLIGLGSRIERPGQNPYTEQFWELSSTTVEANKWGDAVFAIRGNSGINIRALVVVPDCESPHNLTDDFLFYVDNIEVNSSPISRIINEYYPISGSKAETTLNRSDRYTSGISIKVNGKTQSQTINQQSNKKLYHDLTDATFFAQPGNVVTPALDFNAAWMHAYCYIDYNNDGSFDTDSELVAYNYFNGKSSTGQTAPNNPGAANCGKMPNFTIPADLAPGMYRMRMKIDWDCIDPMGNPGDAQGSNEITSNGGVIADIMLCVYADNVTINDFQLNGEILAADGTKLNSLQAPADVPFVIVSAPEHGFHNGGVDIISGFNLSGEQYDRRGNRQYSKTFVPAEAFVNDSYTIPAELMHGNILINGHMEEGTSISEISSTGQAAKVYDLRGLPATPASRLRISRGHKSLAH